MAKIEVMPLEVANLIAAGEVVDRPASIVKELVENAIDAGAKQITVEIKNGGIRFIRVADDGCGISGADLPTAIRRHATSKIHNAEDLDTILTLGFRGEALPSIASVTELRILSKCREEAMGAMLEVQYGMVSDFHEAGCPDGTTVIAEALFANVPARRKFLKKDVTEAQAVNDCMQRIALTHPEISFRYISDGDLKFRTAGDGQLLNAICSIYGREFASKLISIQAEYDDIRISGYIGRTDNVRGNRNCQNFSINGRWIRSKTALAALEQAYTSYIPPERFPVCILALTINPLRVDVNVHPAKLEVRFNNEKPVFEAIYYTTRQALAEDVTRPELTLSDYKGAVAEKRMSEAFVPVEDCTAQIKASKPQQMQVSLPPKQEGAFAHIRAEEYLQMHNQRPTGGASVFPASAPLTPMKQQPVKPIRLQPQSMPEEEKPLMPSDRDVPPEPTTKSAAQQRAFFDRTDVTVCTAPKAPTPDTLPLAQSTRLEAKPVDLPPEAASPDDAQTVQPMEAASPDDAQTVQPMEAASQTAATTAEIPMYRIVGEVFSTYVIVEIPAQNKMLMIDKHAAHERLLFENLKRELSATQTASQLLMLPTEVMLLSGEIQALEDYREELEKIGFSFVCGKNSLSLTALPDGIETAAAGDMLAAIADRILENTGNATLTRDILFEKALYQGACKAAIKGGHTYPPEYIAYLVEQMMQLPDITFCPHGRPVALEMTKQKLDHRFERS